jgi:hypothetical protein
MGCTHVHRDATGTNVAEVGFTTRIAKSPYAHRTAIAVRSDPESRWATVKSRDDIAVRSGVQHFRFEGQWLAHREHHHDHFWYSPCIGCSHHHHGSGTAADAAFVIVGTVIAAAVIASEVEAHRPNVVSTCAVELALDVAKGDDIELTFRHDDADRCDVVCTSYGDSGKRPCRLAQVVASN